MNTRFPIDRTRMALAVACITLLATACSDRGAANAGSSEEGVVDVPAVEALSPPPSANSAVAAEDAAATAPTREPDVVYVPTPQPVVDAMLNMAGVKAGDVLYDLGSGDGRIPITAARRFGIRATGIDINPERISEANANAEEAGVTDKVTFKQADLFEEDFSDATVVTLYLLESLNVKLRPRLLAELKPGTRIVSHAFGMGDWPAEKSQEIDDNVIYMWTVPERGTALPKATE